MIQRGSERKRVKGRTLILLAALVAAAWIAVACTAAEAPATNDRTPEPAATTEVRPADRPKIVILGDSLTAGYGLDKPQSFPSLLQQRLDAEGQKYEVVNAGVSGDTTAGGLRRLDWSIEGNTRILVVALGGNDGLRGLPVAESRKNLSEIITRAQQRGITVILAGMEAPPNYGPTYTGEFRAMFRDLAREHHVPLIPFLLEGVAGVPSLNISDGIHPNPEGARIVERTVWKALAPAIESTASR
jgi:acyl-CoA thioesterase I